MIVEFGIRYALEVNVERSEDVLTHLRLLRQAEDTDNVLAYDVRVVQVLFWNCLLN